MLAGMSLGTDLKRYSRGLLPRIALITIILMPLLYGAMYLWAFWNPFAEVNKVPVALVNEDRGATAQGQQVRAGDEVAAALIDSGQLNLLRGVGAQAAEGVGERQVLLLDHVAAGLQRRYRARCRGPIRNRPSFVSTFNDANNYLASIIGQNASREVLNQVNEKIGERTVGTVVTGLSDAGSGLEQAADGAQQLSTGLDQANDGAQRLSSGSNVLASGLDSAQAGSAQLAAGTRQLSTAVETANGSADSHARPGEARWVWTRPKSAPPHSI